MLRERFDPARKLLASIFNGAPILRVMTRDFARWLIFHDNRRDHDAAAHNNFFPTISVSR